jgi:hypothetical protein
MGLLQPVKFHEFYRTWVFFSQSNSTNFMEHGASSASQIPRIL